MKIENGVLYLSDVSRFNVLGYDEVYYVDTEENRIVIPMKVIVMMYEASRNIAEKQGKEWKVLCDGLFSETSDG